MSDDLRRWINLSKPLGEDIGMLPTSLLNAVPDELVYQLGFFFKVATKLGWDKAARFLQSVMQQQR